MARTIWKFPVSAELGATIDIPVGAQVLTAQLQSGSLVIWALVEADARSVKRAVHVIGTGWTSPFPDNVDYIDYIATFQDGPFVWHVFIEKEA